MRRKLTDDQVREIRRLWSEGVSSPEIGRRFGASPSYVWKLCELQGVPDLRAARFVALAEAKRLQGLARDSEARDAEVRRSLASAALEARDAEARRLWAEGWMGKDIARRLGIARSKVSSIVAGNPRPSRASGPEDNIRAEGSPEIPRPSPRRSARPRPACPFDPRELIDSGTSLRGSDHPGAKLDEARVIEMRKLRAEGWSTNRLSIRFGVGRNTVCYALNGTTWGHVPGAIVVR